MTTDFEYKLKENLIKDVDATNVDVLSEVMKTPFEEKKPKFSFFNMPRRAVATVCASMLLLCVGIFGITSNSQDSATPMPMSLNDMARTMESDVINISDLLQTVMIESEMTDIIEVSVLTSLSESDFASLANLDRELTADDFLNFLYGEDTFIVIELEKSDIINMKDYFYFMLSSEIN
ncbi:MAG: hypothetical protein R3Y18_02850 [Bacillota bacterium]